MKHWVLQILLLCAYAWGKDSGGGGGGGGDDSTGGRREWVGGVDGMCVGLWRKGGVVGGVDGTCVDSGGRGEW